MTLSSEKVGEKSIWGTVVLLNFMSVEYGLFKMTIFHTFVEAK